MGSGEIRAIWNWVNEALQIPAVSLLVGVIIPALPFLSRRVRKWAKKSSGVVWEKTKRFFLNVRPKVYRALGVVPIEDMQAFGEEIRKTANLVSPTVSTSEMKFKDNVFWSHSNDGLKVEGPFCPKCYGGDREEVRLTEYVDDRFWRCSVCYAAVEKPGRASRPMADFDPFTS